ncbi:MAG TPA: biotin-dependent carboxyltransferase family protein [Bacillaceae bacterium]
MIIIHKPGLLSTLQDLGRTGYQQYGVIVSGSMDDFSHRMANLLTGNPEEEATLEMTLMGPTIQFDQEALISICGGDLSPKINGRPVRSWRPIFVKKGTVLEFGYAQKGCRAYLAIAGGFSIPSVMESKSTYLRAGIGGFQGRTLKEEDAVPFGLPSPLGRKIMNSLSGQAGNQPFQEADWSAPDEQRILQKKDGPLRVMKGRQYALFTPDSQTSFFQDAFTVSTESDRMGYRLKGSSLSLAIQEELLSEAVGFGSIQIPPDGNPIILLADRQTTGGYPKIAQIAAVDLPLVAQTKPGETLRFTEVPLEEAQRMYLEREADLSRLKEGIKLKYL